MEPKLIDIYKLALSQGLSGKEAAFKYGVKYHSLWMAGSRHNMPPLVRNNRRTTMYREMTNEQLLKVHDSLLEELKLVQKTFKERGYQSPSDCKR